MAGLVALCASASAVQAAPSAASSIVFLSHTASARPGGRVSVVVAVRGTAKKCIGVLHVGTTSISRSVLVRAKRASLAWTLPLSSRLGGASVTVTCKPSGHVTTAVVVRAAPAPPPPVVLAAVAVQQSGFSTVTTDVDREMNFGVALHETSGVKDALQVQVTANFFDPAGHIVDTEVNTIDRIPAGGTFY